MNISCNFSQDTEFITQLSKNVEAGNYILTAGGQIANPFYTRSTKVIFYGLELDIFRMPNPQ